MTALSDRIEQARPQAFLNLKQVIASHRKLPMKFDAHDWVNVETGMIGVIDVLINQAEQDTTRTEQHLPAMIAGLLHSEMQRSALRHAANPAQHAKERVEAAIILDCMAMALGIEQQTRHAFNLLSSPASGQSPTP